MKQPSTNHHFSLALATIKNYMMADCSLHPDGMVLDMAASRLRQSKKKMVDR